MASFIFTIILLVVIISLLMYLNGLKEGLLHTLIPINIALIWYSVERIINNQFNIVTVVLIIIAILFIILYVWLKKKWKVEGDNKTIKQNSSKNKKRKKRKKK